jgi:hypothetical protein
MLLPIRILVDIERPKGIIKVVSPKLLITVCADTSSILR